jgi:NDP-sugar pyrophosphorylase family protein
MYLLRPEILELIPAGELFHITHLIEKLQGAGGRVGVYPISDKSWIDTGEWVEYKNALKQLNSFLS